MSRGEHVLQNLVVFIQRRFCGSTEHGGPFLSLEMWNYCGTTPNKKVSEVPLFLQGKMFTVVNACAWVYEVCINVSAMSFRA